MVDGLRPVSLAASVSPIAESPVKKILFLAGLRASPMANLTVNSRLRALMVFYMLDLPRFRGEMRAWDQALWVYVMLSSGFVGFFGSAPGGAILPSRPAH